MNCPGKIVVCFAIVLGIDAGLVTAAEPDPIAPKTLPQPAAGDASTPLMPPLPTAEANPNPPAANRSTIRRCPALGCGS